MPRKKPKKKRPEEKPDTRTTAKRMQDMVDCYAETCNLVKAAEAAGISRFTHYKWLKNKKYPKYAEVFAETRQAGVDFLESVAVERSTVGWEEPVYYQGSVCGYVTRYDGGLLQFLLRGMAPEKYGAARMEVSGSIDLVDRLTKARNRVVMFNSNVDARETG